MINKITKGDCLNLMGEIPSSSVDMILCDLPYGTTQCKWDSIIDLTLLWEAYNRVIKPNGAIVLFAAQPFTSMLVSSNYQNFKYDWTWKKPKGTGHLNAKKQPMRDKEDILVFYKEQCTYNPQWGCGDPYQDKSGKALKASTAEVSGNYMNGPGTRNSSDGRRYPKQVLEFGVVERGTIHPTQKPVDLFEYLIKTYTLEGALVLDNCSGSGTTAIAAINTGRKFICMEQDENYHRLSTERVNARIEELLSDILK